MALWFGGSFALPVLAEETEDSPLEAVLGCTDETAENYNPAATQDDGSCTYPEPEPAPAQNPNLHPHPHPYPYPHLHLHPHLN